MKFSITQIRYYTKLYCISEPVRRINYNQSTTDIELGEFISKIKAVDNHAHPNTINPDDKSSDALPLDGLGAIELPARVSIFEK